MSIDKKLIYLPLGGAGEIGMNMYLYGYGSQGLERFILVDIGVSFPSMDTSPGVDLIMADTHFIEERIDRLDGIFITHGHEDHIGALGLLYSRLRAPVYCRKFTAAIARNKMKEYGQDETLIKICKPYPEMQSVGPFDVGFLPLAHSIPEASGLVIETPEQRVIHSGDFKLDPNPIIGEPYNPQMLRAIGDKGVDLLVCDSTNVFTSYPGRSESILGNSIVNLIKDADGMFVATTFASNVARLKTLAQAGVDAGRSVCVLGRSMQKMLGYANETGILDNFPPLIDLEDIKNIPRDNLMLLVTGSQGEGAAASAQLARGKYCGISLKPGDTFLFSSKTIPGNELAVGHIINEFTKQGVYVIDDSVDAYHVSGHANRPDLETLYGLLRPKNLLPMHGEYRHLKEHATLAASHDIASIVAANGTLVQLDGDGLKIIDNIETGRLYLDGYALIGAYDGVVLDRIRIARRGMVAVSLVIEDCDILGVWVKIIGLPDIEHQNLALLLEDEIETVLDNLKLSALQDDSMLEITTQKAVRRIMKKKIGKNPVCSVLISRFEG